MDFKKIVIVGLLVSFSLILALIIGAPFAWNYAGKRTDIAVKDVEEHKDQISKVIGSSFKVNSECTEYEKTLFDEHVTFCFDTESETYDSRYDFKSKQKNENYLTISLRGVTLTSISLGK